MDLTKYVGMDVHTESISIAVVSSAGKIVMESTLETKANTILAAVTHTPHFMSTEPIVMVRVMIAAQATRAFKLRFCDSQAVSSGFLSLLARK
jgi:hypothetical protein